FRVLMFEVDLGTAEAGAKPTAEEPRLRRGSRYTHGVDVRDPRPQRREMRAPARGPRPGDVRDRAARKERRESGVRERQVVPLGRVDDEPVDHVHELLELQMPPRRLAAPAEEDR